MEVILQENYPSLGYVGDKISVRRGYARNFLIPKGIALSAGSANAKALNHKVQGINAKRAKLKVEAQAFLTKLEATNLTFMLKLAPGGKSYGSIVARDIEIALKERGFELDRRQIKMTEPFRRAGDFRVAVKLHTEVVANVPVVITQEQRAIEAKPQDDDAKAGKKRAGRGRKQAESEAVDASLAADVATTDE